jgi:tetratricopeptide (TPR) repeat protein
MPRLPAEIADFLPAGLRSSQVSAHVSLPQPVGSRFRSVCVLLHGEALKLLVRAEEQEEFHAFELAGAETVTLGDGEAPKLVLCTEDGDRHPVSADAEQIAAVQQLVARVPAAALEPPQTETGPPAEADPPEADPPEADPPEADPPEAGPPRAHPSPEDQTPVAAQEREPSPTDGELARGLAVARRELQRGDLADAAATLAELAEAGDAGGARELVDLRRVVLALDGGDLEHAAYIFLELRASTTALDAAVAELLAPDLEDADQPALALQCYSRLDREQAALERARLVRVVEQDADGLDDSYSRGAVTYLRRYLARHADDALARERLGLHLLAQGELSAAVQELERAIDTDPTRWNARHASIRAHAELLQEDAAQRHREQLVRSFTPTEATSPALLRGVAITALRVGRVDRAGELLQLLRRRVDAMTERELDTELLLEVEELEEAFELLRDGRDHEAALCALFWWEQILDGLDELCELMAERLAQRDKLVAAALCSRVEGGRERFAGLFRELGTEGDLDPRALDRIAAELADGSEQVSEQQLTASALRYRAILAFARLEIEEAAEYARRAVALDGADLRSRLTLLRVLEDALLAEREAVGDLGDLGDLGGLPAEASEEALSASAELLQCVEAGLELEPAHPRLLRGRSLYGQQPERALAAVERLLASTPADEQLLAAKARRLRELGRHAELADLVAMMVRLGSDDWSTLSRARQALDGGVAPRPRTEPRRDVSWWKIVIGVGLAIAIAILIWTSGS